MVVLHEKMMQSVTNERTKASQNRQEPFINFQELIEFCSTERLTT